jgi:hypothetical protein
MKVKKGILLFEVAFVVLLVSIISLFLFRGYSVFLKAGRKSLDYLKLIMLSEAKIWDLQMEEKSSELVIDMEKQGDFKTPFFSWQLGIEEAGYEEVKKTVLKVTYENKRKTSLDIVNFFTFQEEK